MTKRLTVPITAALALMAGTVLAAVQGETEAKYQIPVPTEQRKIGVGDTKEFQEGALSLSVVSAERTVATITANGGEAVTVPNSTPTLVAVDDSTICTVVYLGLVGKRAILSARCDPADDQLRAALEDQQNAVPVEVEDPVDLIATAPKGTLENPYLGNAAAIAEGHQLFLSNSCNGCHGGNGGGGMGPALSNGVWVYGKEDDTLFRLVTLGSEQLLADGYARVAREKVVGPMPPYEGIITNADNLWKILAFVRATSKTDAPESN